MRTSLSLRKETLAELTSDELTGVVGASLATVYLSDGRYSCSECWITRDPITLLNC